MENRLVISNVTKIYENKCGIRNISANIKAGEIVAIIGPNGSGKSTLVRTIAGLVKCSAGEVTLNDVVTGEPSCKSLIGYMQENLQFYDKLTVYEILDFICKVKYRGKYHEKIDDFLVKYDLFDKRNTYINKLSLGMKRKLSIAMALIGENELIILDEPTNGVDTAGILKLKHDLSKYASEGKIVIVTSHMLDWIEKMCTRCIFLKDGYIVQDENVQNIELEKIYEKLFLS